MFTLVGDREGTRTHCFLLCQSHSLYGYRAVWISHHSLGSTSKKFGHEIARRNLPSSTTDHSLSVSQTSKRRSNLISISTVWKELWDCIRPNFFINIKHSSWNITQIGNSVMQCLSCAVGASINFDEKWRWSAQRILSNAIIACADNSQVPDMRVSSSVSRIKICS